MPWFIRIQTHEEEMVRWSDAWGESGQPANFDTSLGRNHGYAPTYHGRFPLQQEAGPTVIPDLCPGRMSTQLMVSARAKKLISEWDPITHYFIPVELHLSDGTVLADEHFLFQAGDRVDGIIEDKSNVTPVLDDVGQLRYYSSPSRPLITWKAETLEGRHIWVGANLGWDVFISDQLEAEFRR